METLPLEVVETVLSYLVKADSHSCLTLNKRYYAISVKNLYGKVHFDNNEKLNLFQHSIIHYPRSRQAGKYVRRLSINKDIAVDVFNWNRSFIDILMYFPNIEELAIKPTPDLLQALRDTEKRILLKIKTLNLTINYPFHQNKVMDCYHKFRSSLTTISFKNTLYISPAYLSGKLIKYLSSFKCLDSLELDITCTAINNLVFTDILKVCPTLTNSIFTCISMNVSHLDLARIPTFPQFKDLDIDISEMTLEDAHFIKTSFPQLQKLTLTIQENVEDKYNIIDALIQPTLPDNLTIYCSELSNIDIIVNFVYQLNKRFKKENVSVVNKIAYNKSEYDNLTVLSTEYDPKSCLRIITTTVHYPYRLFKNFQLLEQIGGNLNKLQISDDGYNSVWDLEDINQQCPVLSELVFHSLELVPYSGKPKINKNLTKLTMTKCDIYQNTFKRVELSYPMLEELHLKGNKLVGIDEQAIVCHVHLKLNKLKLIRIYLEDPQTSYLNMVVVKAVDDTWVKLWSYCNEKKKMVVTEKKSAIHEIKLVKEGLLYVLISNTVEDVSFE